MIARKIIEDTYWSARVN